MFFSESTHHSSAKIGMDALLDEIYRLRNRLNEMSRDVSNLSSPRLVEVSQMLDKKLNAYEQLNGRKVANQ